MKYICTTEYLNGTDTIKIGTYADVVQVHYEENTSRSFVIFGLTWIPLDAFAFCFKEAVDDAR
jgi:hypothetical protein